MSVIYEPRGAALEYAQLATNPYGRCPFHCRYCYVPGSMQRPEEEYHQDATVRNNYQRDLEREARTLGAKYGDPADMFSIPQPRPRIHLSFIGDPYQPVERELRQTRQAIKTLKRHSWPVQILTKSGDIPREDFDLFGSADRFGVTLTCLSGTVYDQWEGKAPKPEARIELLREAKAAGIPLWVSIEPIITGAEAMRVLRAITDLQPDLVWLGKLNHVANHNPGASWEAIRDQLVAYCEANELTYSLKDSLKYL